MKKKFLLLPLLLISLVSCSNNVDPTPVEPTPVEPTPVDPTPEEPTPVEPTPEEPTPVDPTPVEPTPTPIIEEKIPTSGGENVPFIDDDDGCYIKGLCSNTIGTYIHFSFSISKYCTNYLKTLLTIKSSNYSKDVYLDKGTYSYLFEDGVLNRVYTFTFTPIYGIYENGKSVQVTRMITNGDVNCDLPVVKINTLYGLWPDADYINAPDGFWGSTIYNNEYVKSDINVYDNELNLLDSYVGSKIKIRGNTSSYGEKKGYKIKLDKKADMLSKFLPEGSRNDKEYSDKEWLLLNKATSLSENTGFEVMRYLGADFTPQYIMVDLFVNGDYRGVYLLLETIKKGNGKDDEQARVKIDNDGFLVECDPYWWNEDLYFETTLTKGTPLRYTFKYPDVDDLEENDSRISYIQKYIDSTEKALMKSSETEYLNYIDLESFVIWILGHDIMGIQDGGGCNMYIYKKDSGNSKICMGPGWDFDSGLTKVESLTTNRWTYYFFTYHLVKKTSFQKEYLKLYNSIKGTIKDYVVQKVTESSVNSMSSFLMENSRFGSNLNYKSNLNRVNTYLTNHLAWMEQQL